MILVTEFAFDVPLSQAEQHYRTISQILNNARFVFRFERQVNYVTCSGIRKITAREVPEAEPSVLPFAHRRLNAARPTLTHFDPIQIRPVGQAVPDEVMPGSGMTRQTAVPLHSGLLESGTA